MQALQIQVLFKHVGTLLYVDSGSSDHAGQMTDWRYRVFEKVMSTMCEEWPESSRKIVAISASFDQ